MLAKLSEQIHNLARHRHEPFYVYVADEIKRLCHTFLELPWEETSVHFATMANDSPEFLDIVRTAGLNVFVNSLIHLDLANSLGWSGEDIIFTASAVDETTMRAVRQSGAVMNLDSLGQVAAWHKLFPNERAGLRCNIGELVNPRSTRAGFFIGPEARLGLTVSELMSLAGQPWVDGLHLYVGTDILDLEHFRECYEQLASLAVHFPNLRHLDFGGGFGVGGEGDAPFDFGAFGQMSSNVMKQLSLELGRPIRLALEPGRIIGATAGYFVTRVLDVKWRDGRQLVGVNASVVQFPRPLFYPDTSYHPVWLLTGREDHDKADVITDICGCSTYSRDYLARDVKLPVAEIGDLVVFGHAGAYCASAFTSFLGFSRPREFMT